MIRLIPWKLVIGGALAGLASYLAWKALHRSTASNSPGAPAPAAKPGGGSTPFQGGKVQRILGNPLVFDQGTHYRLRYTELLLTPAQLDAALPGFGGLSFYREAASLPGDWPSELATQEDPDTHFAEGTWSGAPATVDRPQGLYQVWVT